MTFLRASRRIRLAALGPWLVEVSQVTFKSGTREVSGVQANQSFF